MTFPLLHVGPCPGSDVTLTGLPPPARLPARPILPCLDAATSDDIRDLAANAVRRTDDLYALCGSEPHVLRICLEIERIDLDLGSVSTDRDTQGRVMALQQIELGNLRKEVIALGLLARTERARAERAETLRLDVINQMTAQLKDSYRLSRQVETLTHEVDMHLKRFAVGSRPVPVPALDSFDDTEVSDEPTGGMP
jgi:hypothetical protein